MSSRCPRVLLVAATSAAVSLAAVDVGTAQLPALPAPTLELPSLPSLPSPPPATPRLPSTGSPDGGHLPNLPGVGGVSPGGGGAGVGAPGSVAPLARTGASQLGLSGAGPAGAIAGQPGAGGAQSMRESASRRQADAPRRDEKRFRKTVARHAPCFYVLPRLGQRVLRLRAGLGKQRARDRAQVARRLDLSVRRVRTIEHSGLVLLEAADSISGCAVGGAPARSLTEAAFEAMDGVPYVGTVANGANTVAGLVPAEAGRRAQADRGGVAGARASSADDAPETSGPSDSAALTIDSPQGSGGPPLLLLLAFAALGLATLLAWRRRQGTAAVGASMAEEGPDQRDEQAIEHAFVEELMKSNPHVSAAQTPEEPSSTNRSAHEESHGASTNGQGALARALQRLLGPKL